MPKTLYLEKLSVHLKLPMIKLVDGASGKCPGSLKTTGCLKLKGGGSITTYKSEGGSYLPKLELLYWLVGYIRLGNRHDSDA